MVLSNNDGCAIARSDEAKALGIKMGQPYYQFRDLERVSNLVCLSANFELYGDMSDRMMSLAAGLGPLQEIYSIDESFIGDLDGIPDLTRRAWAIRARIDKWIRHPNLHRACPHQDAGQAVQSRGQGRRAQAGQLSSSAGQGLQLDRADTRDAASICCAARQQVMCWGIGRRIAAKLADQGILTALDVARDAHRPSP